MVSPARTTDSKNGEFRKCGEISAAVKVGKNVYAYNCAFCTAPTCLPFFELENFMVHIEEQHRLEFDVGLGFVEDDVLTLPKQKEFLTRINKDCFLAAPLDNEQTQLPEKMFNEITQLTKTEEFKFSDIIKENKECSLNFNDPLDEPPLSVLPADFPKIFDVKEEIDVMVGEGVNFGKQFDGDFEDGMADNFHCDNANNTDSSETEDSSVSDIVSDGHDLDAGENDKDITLAIIDGYEKHRLLWDANEPNAKNRKKRLEALNKISQCLQKKMGVQLKVENISARIKKLRYKFRSELQNQKVAKAKEENYTPLWFYDKLSFLNSSIKYKQRNKRGAKALANEKSALPLSSLTDDQNLELIDIYKSFPCLWDVEDISYRFKNKRQDALDEMLQAIRNKINLDLTQDELQKKIYRIRYACTQEKHRKLQCESVKEAFKPKNKYYESISFLEPHVGPFKCAFCEQIFNGADQYKIHKFKHDGSMPFTCPICKRGFMRSGNCTVHLRRHTRDYPFECKVCGKRYATSTDVSVHMRYHTGEKPYFCEICGRSFRTWTFFDAHMRRHQKRPTHKCTICMKAFYENNKLKEHMKAHLNVRDKVCNTCGKAFTSSKYLRQHKQIHAEKKKYACKICGKDFAQYAGLSGHMKSHGTTVTGAISEENR